MSQDQNQNNTKPVLDQDQNQVPKQDQNQVPNMDQNQVPNQDQNQEAKPKNQNQPKPARNKTKDQAVVRTRESTPVPNQVQDQVQDKTETEAETFCSYIYNPRKGTVLGRDRKSWGHILLFYLVFYTFLSILFFVTLGSVLLTLDPDSPKYTDMLQNPGMVVQPQLLEISYNRSDPSDYGPYVEQLHRLLHKYNDSLQAGNDLCLAGEFTIQDPDPDRNRKPVQRKVCQFKRSLLRSCSGLVDQSFGFKDGRPCVILRMNRVVGLKPTGDPYINCTSKIPIKMQYFPPDARLDRMFFPYYGKRIHAGYVQPLVALKLLFSRRDVNVVHSITCRVQGSGIKNNNYRDRNQGRVSFKIRVTQ